MDETRKPFACKADGCDMSFTNEDHLEVHTKKHRMSLHLGMSSKAVSFIADQTPTPTRLISKCEEMGLFEGDSWKLQNPFDETFRRAVEAKSTSSTPIEAAAVGDELVALRPANNIHSDSAKTQCVGDETLNTPQVLPYYDVTAADCRFATSPMDHQSRTLGEPFEKSSVGGEKTRPRAVRTMSRPKTPDNAADAPTQMKMPKLVIISPPPLAVLEKRTSSASSVHAQMQKAVPELVQLTKVSPSVVARHSAATVNGGDVLIGDHQTSQSIRDKLKMQIVKKTQHEETTVLVRVHAPTSQIVATNSSVATRRKAKSFPEETKSTGQRFERNRAAAQRYRSKMKEWKMEMLRNNARLEEENQTLRAQIEKLNVFMMAHQKCSVSKAMAQGNCIPIGPPKVLIKSANHQVAGKRPIQPHKHVISSAVTTTAVCLGTNTSDITTNPIYFLINQKPNTT